jgi:hypothetical protein
MKLIIAVIATDASDFKFFFQNNDNQNIKYIYVDSYLCLRGINLNGMVITDLANKDPEKRNLFKEAFYYNCICR